MLEYEIETNEFKENNLKANLVANNYNIKNTTQMNKKWADFFALSSSISKIIKFTHLNKINKKQNNILASRVDQFIATSNYNVVFQMLESGYELNNKQYSLMQKFIDKGLSLSNPLENFQNIERALILGLKPSVKALDNYFATLLGSSKEVLKNIDFKLEFFLETDKIISIKENIYEGNNGYPKETRNHIFPQTTNLLREHLLNTQVFDNFFTRESKLLLKKDKRPTSTKLTGHYYYDKYQEEKKYEMFTKSLYSNNVEKMLKQVSFDKFINFFTEYTKTFPNDKYYIKKQCQYLLDTHYKNNVNDIVTQTKQIYKDHIIEKITSQNIVNDSYNINVNQIPDIAKQLVKDITQTYNNIIANKVEDFDINNLFEKRVPEVLKKYLLIDKVYQTTLKNSEGKNAEQLMIESLQNIKQSFDNKWQEINESALSSLSVTHKYTKNFK